MLRRSCLLPQVPRQAAEFAAARNPTPAGGSSSSSSSSSSRAAAKERFSAGLAAEVAAARNPVPAGGSSSSSSSRVSGYVRDLLDLLQPESAMNLGEGELLPLLQELEGQALLPAREVRFFTEEASPADDNITLRSHPRKFRQLLEAAIIRSVLLTVPETEAKGAAINAVVQLLLLSTSGSSSMLQLQGKPVSIDRIEVAGSVAERLAGGSSTTAAAAAAAAAGGGAAYGGRYVLDLLLEVLQVAKDWTAAAAGRLGQPVLFLDLAGGRYYSKQQAEALRVFGITSRDARGSGQPLVVHPVDPTCSVFDQTEAPFQLWAEFGRAAQRLQQQLLTCSWGEIARNSSLSAVVA
ncbi:hypothetical protein OEZ85_000337 [Tetradesmus obliquus]|uniref:Uncharacterized protein n=1 Tax=Tetradesmus obliquus TaxID=3088 RepID=A0ABY8UPY9_TETOB|nr:hypothetical protein OEZ85_000337 [Tetradesmus obliquus]